jgi:hypothetical protein
VNKPSEHLGNEVTTEQYLQLIIDTAECAENQQDPKRAEELLVMAYDLMFADPDLNYIMGEENLTAPQMLERIIHDCKQTG